MIMKKEGRKWKTHIGNKHLVSFLDIFNLVQSTNDRNYYKGLKVKLIRERVFFYFLTFLFSFNKSPPLYCHFYLVHIFDMLVSWPDSSRVSGPKARTWPGPTTSNLLTQASQKPEPRLSGFGQRQARLD